MIGRYSNLIVKNRIPKCNSYVYDIKAKKCKPPCRIGGGGHISVCTKLLPTKRLKFNFIASYFYEDDHTYFVSYSSRHFK